MLSALHLLFSSGTVSEYVETSELKSYFIRKSYAVIYVVYCIVLHCLISPVDRKFCELLISSAWLFTEMFSLQASDGCSCRDRLVPKVVTVSAVSLSTTVVASSTTPS